MCKGTRADIWNDSTAHTQHPRIGSPQLTRARMAKLENEPQREDNMMRLIMRVWIGRSCSAESGSFRHVQYVGWDGTAMVPLEA